MAEANQPKKETVRIALPPRTGMANGENTTPKRDTVRINLPARPPISSTAAPSKPLTPPTFVPPMRSATASPSAPATATARIIESAPMPTPKKETARISILPDPPKTSASVQMKKTQLLITTMPEAKITPAAINVAPDVSSEEDVDLVPMSLCWTILAASALILLIQIWNYFA